MSVVQFDMIYIISCNIMNIASDDGHFANYISHKCVIFTQIFKYNDTDNRIQFFYDRLIRACSTHMTKLVIIFRGDQTKLRKVIRRLLIILKYYLST